MAENDAAAAEAEASKKAAEKELTFSLPGLFSKADPERMRMAIAAARTAGVALAERVTSDFPPAAVADNAAYHHGS